MVTRQMFHQYLPQTHLVPLHLQVVSWPASLDPKVAREEQERLWQHPQMYLRGTKEKRSPKTTLGRKCGDGMLTAWWMKKME